MTSKKRQRELWQSVHSRAISALDMMAELLSRPGRWIQGDLARREDGVATWVLDGTRNGPAHSMCLLGAARYAIFSDEEAAKATPPWLIERTISRAIYAHAVAGGDLPSLGAPFKVSLADWNDEVGRTQDEVVAAVRAARVLVMREAVLDLEDADDATALLEPILLENV